MMHTTLGPINRVLAALEAHNCRPKQRPGKPGCWNFHCPCSRHANGDRTASGSLDPGIEGKALVCCHANGPTEEIVALIGLEMRDLFPPNGRAASSPPSPAREARVLALHRPPPAPSQVPAPSQPAEPAEPAETPERRIVGTYDYTDASGNLLYQKVRYTPKEFRQRRPDPSQPTGWTWNLTGVAPVLYRLPSLAANTGDPVFVVEGEKDADRLAGEGLTATCNSGGAGKWRPEYSETLRGKDVVILPDNDEPGRRHAEQVAHSLHGIAQSVRVVALPGLPDKGDVSDWLDAGGTISELCRLPGITPEWIPSAEPEPEPGSNVATVNTAVESVLPRPQRLLDVAPAAPLGFVVDRLFVAGEVNGLVGEGDAGKSSALIAIAGAVAAGAPALGELATIAGPVLYVSGEDTAAFIRNRAEAFAAGYRWDRDRMLGNFLVYDEGVDLDDERWQDHLIEAANDLHIVLAIFDPLVDLCGAGVDENSNSDAKRVTKYLRRLIRETRATPVLAMHVSKPAEGKTDRRHRVRGASAWRNATRSCWWAEAQEGGMELDPIKSNRLIRPTPLRVKRTVTADAAFPMLWRAAHFALDTAGDVVGRDVLRIVGWIAACQEPPTSREVAAGDHNIPRDRAQSALVTARTRGWVGYQEGPRRARLWTVTEAGRARLLLESAPVYASVR